MPNAYHQKRQHGFTLLEVLLVIMIMGLLASTISFTSFADSPQEELEKEALRIQALVQMASEHAVLNQYELGLHVDEEGYQFLIFDEENWLPLTEPKQFAARVIDDPFSIALELEGLSWAEDSLLASTEWQPEDDSLFEDTDLLELDGDKPKKPEIIPQIFILSSGEVTPSRITFAFDEVGEDAVYYEVNAKFTVPLEVVGPLDRPSS